MKKDTGGQAFPFTPTQDRHMKTGGMTLRDYFAAKAMAALTSVEVARWSGWRSLDGQGMAEVARWSGGGGGR